MPSKIDLKKASAHVHTWPRVPQSHQFQDRSSQKGTSCLILVSTFYAFRKSVVSTLPHNAMLWWWARRQTWGLCFVCDLTQRTIGWMGWLAEYESWLGSLWQNPNSVRRKWDVGMGVFGGMKILAYKETRPRRNSFWASDSLSPHPISSGSPVSFILSHKFFHSRESPLLLSTSNHRRGKLSQQPLAESKALFKLVSCSVMNFHSGLTGNWETVTINNLLLVSTSLFCVVITALSNGFECTLLTLIQKLVKTTSNCKVVVISTTFKKLYDSSLGYPA